MVSRRAAEVTPELEAEARRLCLENCRAAICMDNKQCFNSWPGNGSASWFEIYLCAAEKALTEGQG